MNGGDPARRAGSRRCPGATPADDVEVDTELPREVSRKLRLQCRLRDFHRSVQSCGDPGAADDGVVVGEDRSEVIDGVLDQVTTNDAYPEFADLRDVVLLGRDGGVDGGPRSKTSTTDSATPAARRTTLRSTGMPSSPAPMTRIFRDGPFQSLVMCSFLQLPRGSGANTSATINVDITVKVKSVATDGRTPA